MITTDDRRAQGREFAMPVGRPTKYKSEMCEDVIECGKQGMGVCEMSAELGIHHSTFADWRENNKEFSEAVKQALRYSQAWWERQGRVATFGGSPGFNATSYIFQMKNRFPSDWRDKQDVEHSGGVSVTLESDVESL